MKQEDKQQQLRLKDLSARMPYGVKIMVKGWDSEKDLEFTKIETLRGIDDGFIYTKTSDKEVHSSVEPTLILLDYKPYLRPMSSMTEEECDKVEEILGDKCIFDFMSNGDIILKQGQFSQNKLAELYDYFNSIHVDYRGLIPNGLAIEVTEENNPYK
jgi:hypothetical protein